MLAAAMQAAGLSVGLYTSPHIHCFNERIRINGKSISNKILLEKLQAMMPVALNCGASYFEVSTVLALGCFSETAVDVEILEAGVGARLDATTAVPADMALITPIALDHQAWLGDSLGEIAEEKAWAMDGCTYAISSPQSAEVSDVLIRRWPNLDFSGDEPSLPKLRAAGNHQRINAALALAAMHQLQQNGIVNITPKDAGQAIAETEIPGRLQYVRWGDCHIWLDAAHNAHAVQNLLPSLPRLADPFDAVFVFTREERDLREMFPKLRQRSRRLIGSDRYRNACDINYADLDTALASELNLESGKSYLILGSFLTVSAALQWVEENTP